ncbi:MAG: ABC transporter, permease protein 2 (cluster 1, maltose/g3p/polyamine/iron), partial [uncultured Thermomicrobiales bacterium]
GGGNYPRTQHLFPVQPGPARHRPRPRPQGRRLCRPDPRHDRDHRPVLLLGLAVADAAGGDRPPDPARRPAAERDPVRRVPRGADLVGPAALVLQQHLGRIHLGGRSLPVRHGGRLRLRPDGVPRQEPGVPDDHQHADDPRHGHDHPQVHHPQRDGPAEHLRRPDDPVPGQRLRRLPDAAVLRELPGRPGGRRPAGRREPLPDLLPDRPAERRRGADRADHRVVPGVVEQLPRAADLHQQPGPTDAAHRPGLLPAGERHQLPGPDGGRRRLDHPDRDRLLRLPALLPPELDQFRHQGV